MSTKTSGLALVAALALAACGGGSMSAEDYYDGAESAAATYDDETDAIFGRYRDAVAEALAGFEERTEGPETDTGTLVEETARLLEVTVTEVTSAFEGAETALAAFVAEMEELDPPSEIEDEHGEVLAALQRSLDSIPDLVDALLETQSLADVSETINASSFGDTQPRLRAACLELEAAASGFDVEADLRCGGSEEADSSN